MSCSRTCKAEFQLANFGLEFGEPSRFTRFEFGCSRFYIIWRLLMAVYHIAMVILTGFLNVDSWTRTQTDEVKWFVYLTHWMFLSLTLCTLIEALAVVYTNLYRADILNGMTTSMPVYLRITWVFQNVSNGMSILTSTLYWGLLYTPGMIVQDIDIITHGGNVIYVFINFFLMASPVRVYHFLHTFIVAVLYVIFTVIYFYAGGTNGLGFGSIYSVLDWSDPGTAAMYSCLTALVGVPIVHLLLWGLYLLRVKLYSLCLGSRSSVDIQMQNVEKA